MPKPLTFTKEERLCSKTELDSLFAGGKSVFVYPFKFIFQMADAQQKFPARVVFSVPKRSFKKAVDRNLIRRRMREAYRLQKAEFYTQMEQNISLMIIYIDKDILEYSSIEKGMNKGLKKLLLKIKQG
jgi:ribonuclease P protein component